MRKTIRFALLAFLLAAFMVLAMTACGKQPTPDVPPTPPPTYTITFIADGASQTVTVNEGDVPAWQGDAPTRPNEVDTYGETVSYTFVGWDKEPTAATEDTTYTAVFKKLFTVYWTLPDGVETTLCKEGDTPTPPDIFKQSFQTAQYDSTFSRWQPALAPIDENGMQYRAVYDNVLRNYTVTYKVGDRVVGEKTLPYGSKVNLPENMPTVDGKACAILSDKVVVTGDTEYQCMLTTLDPVRLGEAYSESLLAYAGSNDNGNAPMKKASALQYLLIQQRNDPNDMIRDRILEHLRKLIAGGNEPYFDLEPYWNYPMTTACLAMAKDTASVWSQLEPIEVEKLDMIMKAFTVICALGTDDYNNFSTGPGLFGNFGKNWNPNYRLANVPQILFCKAYFGSTEATNNVLKDFDYDEYMAKFKEYGFTRAYNNWEPEVPTDTSINFTHPRDFMNGQKDAHGNWMTINAYLGRREDPSGRLSANGGERAGSGKGIVAAGERGYTYKGFTLDQVAEIFNNLLEHNYSGGYVISQLGTYPLYPNAHYPNTNDKGQVVDKYGSTVCSYILSSKMENGVRVFYYEPGKKSICEGMLGMMLEFKSGDGGSGRPGSLNYRSSCSYTVHDFIMVMSCIAGLKELDMYDLKAESNTAIAKKVWVGNTDFLYKIGEGYMSFSLGEAYVSQEGSGDGYLFWKSYWYQFYADDYKLEDFPRQEVITQNDNSIVCAASESVSPDMTETFPHLYDSTTTGTNVWENDFIFEFTLRYDDDVTDFGIRLRSSVRSDGGNRGDIIYFGKDGGLRPTAGFLTPIGTSPQIVYVGDYGWHRITLQYHQGATANEASKSVDYSIVITIYVDGVYMGEYAGNLAEFINRGWLNYTATYDESVEGHLVYSPYTPKPEGTHAWTETSKNNVYWQFYKGGCYNDAEKQWFLQYKEATAYVAKTPRAPVARVTYVLNGGEFTQDETVKVNGYTKSYTAYSAPHFYYVNSSLDLPTPTREGYTFTGWYQSAEMDGEPGVLDLSPTDGITLYAGWEKNA